MSSHPWINFNIDLTKLPYSAWLDLGACASKCVHISKVPLKPNVAAEMHKIYLAKGARATTAIEGNTLTEEEVLLRMDKKLELPQSKEYLGQEVDNILELCNEIMEGIKKGEQDTFNVERLCHFNEVILKKVPVNDYVEPGKIRTCDVVVGPYKAPPHQEVEEMLRKFCEWLNSDQFKIDESRPIASSIIKAITAHLYMAWIHPFGDGNGRIARILEFAILLHSGVPSPASHLLSNHYNATRNEYYRHLEIASKANNINAFFAYAIQGLKDGLSEQLQFIFNLIVDISWESHIYEQFDKAKGHESTIKRKRELLLELSKHSNPVPYEKLITLSQATIERYKEVAPRSLDRDLDDLHEMGLIKVSEEGYLAKKETILSLLPLCASS